MRNDFDPHRVRPLVLVLAAYAVMGVAYQRVVPLFEGPDEASHLEYVAFLSLEKRLPEFGADPEVPGQGMQPPLTYLLSVPLFRFMIADESGVRRGLHDLNRVVYGYSKPAPQRKPGFLDLSRPPTVFAHPEFGSLPNLRWPGLVYGCLAVALTYLAMMRALGDPNLAAMSAGLLAFNPQFLFVTSYVNNDAASATLGAAVFWLVAVSLARPEGPRRRSYLLLALLAMASVFTKNNLLVGIAVAFVALFAVDARPMQRRLVDLGLALSLCLPLVPYLAWNLDHRGDLLGMGAVWQSADHLMTHDDFGGRWSYLLGMYWHWTFDSYWCRFGLLDLVVKPWVTLTFLALTGVGVTGFVLAGRAKPLLPETRSLRVYLGAATLATLAAHVWYNVGMPQPQGRHLFPVAPEIASLLAIGIVRLAPGGRDRSGRTAMFVLLGVYALAAWCLLGEILPWYAGDPFWRFEAYR